MKHNLKVIFILVLMFLISQLIGLYIASQSIGQEQLALGLEKPQFGEDVGFAYIFFLILIATIIALILAKFNALKLWKIWFFISIVLVLTISLSFLIEEKLALIFGLIAAYFKVIKPNIIVHNASELFLYAGLTVLFVETLNLLTVTILIVLIAVYDMYAVWKSKHMIKLAKFQTKAKVFTGFLIPYIERKKERVAMLGGGDVGFPMLFSSVAMVSLGSKALVIPFVVSLSLLLLLYYGDKNKFYPAMPYLGAGCFVGYGLALLI